MAGDTSLSRIVYRKDERGVILDSAVVVGDEDVPEGFEDKAEYESYVPTAKEAPPVEESKLTVSEGQVDLRQTVDVILGDNQEGPSDPGGLEDNGAADLPEGGPQPGDEVAADDGSAEHDSTETIDETLGDNQEGPSDPRGEQSESDESTPRRRRSRS